jgi:hypothetical protein
MLLPAEASAPAGADDDDASEWRGGGVLRAWAPLHTHAEFKTHGS